MDKAMSTAEQILIKNVGKLALSGLKWKSLDDRKQLVIKAMSEYADQENQALRSELQKQKEVTEQAAKIMREFCKRVEVGEVRSKRTYDKMMAFMEYNSLLNPPTT